MHVSTKKAVGWGGAGRDMMTDCGAVMISRSRRVEEQLQPRDDDPRPVVRVEDDGVRPLRVGVHVRGSVRRLAAAAAAVPAVRRQQVLEQGRHLPPTAPPAHIIGSQWVQTPRHGDPISAPTCVPLTPSITW